MSAWDDIDGNDRKNIVELFLSGVSRNQIAQKYEILYKQVCSILFEAGIYEQDMRRIMARRYRLPVVPFKDIKNKDIPKSEPVLVYKGMGKRPYALVIPFGIFADKEEEIMAILEGEKC